jgi:hypothetical protein
MNQITLQIDGSIHSGIHPSGEAKSAIGHLGDRVLLEDGYCLRCFFRLLAQHPELLGLSEFLPGLMERYRQLAEAVAGYPVKDTLEFGKTIEMIGVPCRPRLEMYASLRSPSKEQPLEIRSMDLAGLLDIPLGLGKLRHIIFGDRVDEFEFETAYTLFEFIDGIAWELGFLTSPGECNIRR